MLRAPDGEEAVRSFQNHAATIAAVVLDVVMPRMGGVAASRAVPLMAPDGTVLLMSGYSAEVLSLTEREDDPVEFVAKPYSPDDLLLRLRTVLDEKRRLVS